MIEVILTVMSFVAGIGLGLLFFGGLWLTVKIATNSEIPALWFCGSLTLRLAIVLAGFYYLAAGNLIRLICCLTGFVIARFLVIRLTKAYDLNQQKKEAPHGS